MFSVGVCDRFAARASQGQTVRSDRTVQSGIFICRGTYTKKGSCSTCRARRKGMMNRSMGKARSSRKQRLDGARKGRAARPGNRVPRIVKARGAAVAVPANDTALEVRALDPEMVPANAVTPADVEGLDDQACCRRARPARPRSSSWRLRPSTPRPSRTTSSETEEAEDSEEAEDIDAELSGTAARRSAARKSRPASWRCTSATWRSWTSCARSRSSRPRGRSRRWSWISGGRSWVRVGRRLDR